MGRGRYYICISDIYSGVSIVYFELYVADAAADCIHNHWFIDISDDGWYSYWNRSFCRKAKETMSSQL